MAEVIDLALTQDGYALKQHDIPEADFAAYAATAREVIGIALNNRTVEEALTLNLFGGSTAVAGFGLSRSRGPKDQDPDKYTLQLGIQSEAGALEILAARSQPKILREFWDTHRELVMSVIRLGHTTLAEDLGAVDLANSLLAVDDNQLNVHIRTNWYIGALSPKVEPGTEILSAHIDRGPITFHLYETDAGFLVGAPYSRELALAPDTPDRRQKIRQMRQNLRPIEPSEGNAALLLGAGWWNLPPELLPGDSLDLPSCYHLGQQLNESHAQSVYRTDVVGATKDRVSLVAFIDPPLGMLEAGNYSVPSREVARPNYL